VSWSDAGGLISAGAAYGGTIDTCCLNPLGGRPAFVRDSFGYTATQLDLASLAGQNARFRFRIGTDFSFDDYGWFVDDVRVYQCVAGTPAHDLAVAKITAPRSVASASPVTKAVKVQIQNRSDHPEQVELADLGDGQATGLVRLTVPVVDDDGEGCQGAAVALDAARNAKTFARGPKVLKPKAKLTVYYQVTYECTSPAPKNSADLTPGDYAHEASVHHDVLDGLPDAHPADDRCPRSVTPPFEIDPNPDGTIKDKGCGTRKADRTSGDPVLTDFYAR
jgi:hypothetical protein